MEVVDRGRIEHRVQLLGTIQPVRLVEVSAPVVSRIEDLLIRIGDEVREGQTLATLERDDLRAAARRAEAALEIARLELRQAQARLSLGQQSLSRHRQLFESGLVSAESLEQKQLEFRETGLGLEKAGERVLQAEADRERAASELQKSIVVAPISGRVIGVEAEIGEVVVAGTLNSRGSVLATIADFRQVLVEVDVPEHEVVHLRAGNEAVVEVEAIPNRRLAGLLVEIASAPRREPGSNGVRYPARILLQEPILALRAGMSARVTVAVDVRDEVPFVPVQAVVKRQMEGEGEEPVTVVWVEESGRVLPRQVALGLADGQRVELVSGVALGERVVVGPYRALRSLVLGALVSPRSSRASGSIRS